MTLFKPQAPTRYPTFAPPPPRNPIQPVATEIVCGPEVLLDSRRALEGTETETNGDVAAAFTAERDLATFWTPESCYAACLPQLAPATSFVVNIYFNENNVQTCTCCRNCEGVRYVPR